VTSALDKDDFMNKTFRSLRTLIAVESILSMLLLAGCNLAAPLAPSATEPPPGTATPTGGVIAGRVWQDMCERPAGGEMPAVPPPGCVDDGAGALRANGLPDPGEAGIPAVVVKLGLAPCPSDSPIATTTTGDDGVYAFTALPAGTYCVSIDSGAQSAVVFKSGGWSVLNGPGTATIQIELQAGQVESGVHFGWDVDMPASAAATPTGEMSPGPATPIPPTAETSESATPEISATPTPTPTPASTTATATPTLASDDPKAGLGIPSFHDDFASASNWPLFSDDHVQFAIKDHELQMSAFNADFWDGWMLTMPTYQNVYLEASGTAGTCGGRDHWGLVIRSSKGDHGYIGYFFGITCDGRYSLRAWDGEHFTRLIDWTANAAIKAGADQANTIGIKAIGSRLSLYANAKLLAEVTDPTYSKGLFGVFIGSAQTADFGVNLSNVDAWELP
jgi:hypothetical protein